ncbi:MAG: hypothetical protein P8X96_16575 [Desulfobacteraceae bacterium]
MNRRSSVFIRIGLWITASAFFGCAATPLVKDTSQWHLRSSGAYDTFRGRAFYGIGYAEGLRNATLLRATAVNRAREELTKVLDGYVVELFQATQTTPALSVEEDEQMIGGLVRDAMKLAVISDQWKDPETGGLYALCRLGLDRFTQVLAAQTAILPDVRAAMAAEAENLHSMMAQPSLHPNHTQ